MMETETDQMTVEQWLATRKEAGLKIDPETAEVDWIYAQTLDPYGVYRTSRRNASKLGVNILPVLPEATYGSILVICPRRSKPRCGKSINESWPSPLDGKGFFTLIDPRNARTHERPHYSLAIPIRH